MSRKWLYVCVIALPELLPTIVFSFFLVAAIAFGAYGTALALAGTQVNILPLLLYSRVSGTGTDFPQAAAISLVLMFVCSMMMGIAGLGTISEMALGLQFGKRVFAITEKPVLEGVEAYPAWEALAEPFYAAVLGRSE